MRESINFSTVILQSSQWIQKEVGMLLRLNGLVILIVVLIQSHLERT